MLRLAIDANTTGNWTTGRAETRNPKLAPVRRLCGVYFLAWCSEMPSSFGPTAADSKYIGESGSFLSRLGQFGNSAGFFYDGVRREGHSAGWRWRHDREHTWVSFYPVGNELIPDRPHLAAGLRVWMEAVALEEYRLLYHRLPEINEATGALGGVSSEPDIGTGRRTTDG